MSEYNKGGVVHGGPIPVHIGVEECIIRANAARWLCVRTDAAHLAVAHQPAEPAGDNPGGEP